MNVDDVKTPEYPKTCWLEAIFNRQHELMEKYGPIEKASGLVQTEDCPVNLHDKRGQARLKDFAWRITEEIAEAIEVVARHSGWSTVPAETSHAREEMADALHFLTELSILAGLEPAWILGHYANGPAGNLSPLLGHPSGDIEDYSYITTAVTLFVTRLGIAMNCLKNKPWKQTHMETDVNTFREALRTAWYAFGYLLSTLGFTEKMVYDYYFRKSEVNKFRQRSNY
jgi:dimeric dUTPase (all-alpha-NTP-PPase superfamily)